MTLYHQSLHYTVSLPFCSALSSSQSKGTVSDNDSSALLAILTVLTLTAVVSKAFRRRRTLVVVSRLLVCVQVFNRSIGDSLPAVGQRKHIEETRCAAFCHLREDSVGAHASVWSWLTWRHGCQSSVASASLFTGIVSATFHVSVCWYYIGRYASIGGVQAVVVHVRGIPLVLITTILVLSFISDSVL